MTMVCPVAHEDSCEIISSTGDRFDQGAVLFVYNLFGTILQQLTGWFVDNFMLT